MTVTDADDETYRKNVRNMVLVLGAMIIIVLAFIFIPPLIYRPHEQFMPRVTVISPNGFSLNLSLNSTHFVSGSTISFSVWLNNTENQINDLPAQGSWALPSLAATPCGAALPFRLGVIPGYYGSDNVSLARPLQISYLNSTCPTTAPIGVPQHFIMEPHSLQAIVKSTTGVQQFDMRATFTANGYASDGNANRFAGTFTVVLGDEWGDIAITHFVASSS
jgi:hypothetical protein